MYAKRTHRVFNGDLECRLLRFDLGEASEPRTPRPRAPSGRAAPAHRCSPIGCARISQRLDAWAEREHIDCFRALRRRHAGVRVRHRSVRPRAAPRLPAGIRRAEVGGPGRARASAAARCWRPCREVLAGAARAHSFAGPQAAERRRAVREARARRGPNGGARSGAQVLGEFSATIWTRDCSSITVSCAACCATGPGMRIS